MSTPETLRSPKQCLEALAQTSTRRPIGMVGWMHYGYALRYGGIREHADGADEMLQLDREAPKLGKDVLSQALPLIAARAWAAGSLLLRHLPSVIWQDLTPIARGYYLAGLSTHMRRAASPDALEFLIADQFSGTDSPDLFDVTAEILQRLPTVSLDAESAAEIGANAIHANRLDVLRTILSRPDLPEEPVCRVGDDSQTRDWAEQLAQHSARVKDVLLEAAVRCHHAGAMRLLLDCGANPNIPCWNLERSYNEWFCALSFAINAAREHPKAVAQAMIDALLDHGADPQGLECDGRNHSLMRAMLQQEWRFADRLLALGAKFEGGQATQVERLRKFPDRMPSAYPWLGFREKEDLQWVEQSIAPLVPLAEITAVPLYKQAHAMIGSVSTFLNTVLADEQLPMLQHYEALGLPTTLTPTLILDMVHGGCHAALCYLLRNNPNLPRVMFRVRRRKHDFGVASRQVYLCQPEPDDSNVVPVFDPGGLEPLLLPDGSRVHAYLDAIAEPGHQHGPITEGCFWLEKISANYTRRRERIVTHDVRRIWRMQAVPENVYQIPDLVPLVKEVDGRFIWLGINANNLRFSQKMPANWRAATRAWTEGKAWQGVVDRFNERLTAQRAANKGLPQPMLSEDELKPYPREFWPFLRHLEDGTIGMTEDGCRASPNMLDIYSVWERQNKPGKDFQPDPRLLEWPMWPKVPVELRPYFYYDELFGKPSVTFNSRNDYEKEMIHKAVQWNNTWMIRSMKDAGIL